jgi:hypothetical protein
MADTYSSFQSLLEEAAVSVVSADAWLKSDSGFRVQVTTFEQGLRQGSRPFNTHELPAIAFTVDGGSSDIDDDGSLDTIVEEAILGAYVIVQDPDLQTRRTLCMDIGARVKRIFREQVGSGAWGNLATSIPGQVGNAIETEVSGPSVDDLGETETGSTSTIAVGTVIARVRIDVDDDIT